MAKDKKTPKETTETFLKMTKAFVSGNPKPKKLNPEKMTIGKVKDRLILFSEVYAKGAQSKKSGLKYDVCAFAFPEGLTKEVEDRYKKQYVEYCNVYRNISEIEGKAVQFYILVRYYDNSLQWMPLKDFETHFEPVI